MNRAGPANLGGKQIPSGEANCLGNLTFVITGVLDSLEREDAKDLIEKHGGRVVGSISKKVTHLVVGLDAGESKLAKARQQNVAEINEDQLMEMIRTRPASAVKSVTPASSKKKSKPSGEANHRRRTREGWGARAPPWIRRWPIRRNTNLGLSPPLEPRNCP